MKAIYTRAQQIGVSMCDASGRLSHPCAFSLFQDIASEHAEQIGVGFKTMQESHSFWVTVRTRVRFFNRPGIMDEAELTTWPAAPGSTRCDRSYRMTMGGETLAEGRTEWCVLDTQKGAVKPLADVPFAEGLEYLDEIAAPGPYARFRHNFADEDLALEYTVRATDIDVGRHMNNVAYLRAIMDSFSVADLEGMEISEMEILFCLSCFEGDKLDILRRKTDWGYEFGVRRPDGRYAALALMRCEAK